MFKSFFALTTLIFGVFGDGHGHGGHNHGGDDDYEIISAFFSVELSSNPNVTLESVEYDSENSLLFYQSFLEGIIYVVDYDIDEINDGTFSLSGATAMDNGNFTVLFPTGMYSDGTYLYVLSAFTTYITIYDIDSMTAVMQLAILFDGATTQLNGICNDPSNDDIIYVTSPGANFIYSTYTGDAALYKVNTTDLSYTMVANFSNEEHPNGCAVSSSGNYVYMVSFWLDGSGNFIRYDVDDEDYDVLSGMENYAGDGLIFDNDNNLYFTRWGNETREGAVYIINDRSGNSVSFEKVVTNLTNPADCSYDSDNNYMIVPEFGFPGAIAWVDLNNLTDSDNDNGNNNSDSDWGNIVLPNGYLLGIFGLLFGVLAQ